MGTGIVICLIRTRSVWAIQLKKNLSLYFIDKTKIFFKLHCYRKNSIFYGRDIWLIRNICWKITVLHADKNPSQRMQQSRKRSKTKTQKPIRILFLSAKGMLRTHKTRMTPRWQDPYTRQMQIKGQLNCKKTHICV